MTANNLDLAWRQELKSALHPLEAECQWIVNSLRKKRPCIRKLTKRDLSIISEDTTIHCRNYTSTGLEGVSCISTSLRECKTESMAVLPLLDKLTS